jgi:DUF2905 family protein
MRLHDERAEWKLVFAAAFVSSFGIVGSPATSSSSGMTFYFPLVTCLLLSLLFSLVYWVGSR